LPDSAETIETTDRKHIWWLVVVIIYIVLVLGIDTLAAQRAHWPFPWSRLQWHLSTTFPSLRGTAWAGFDVFKSVFWLIIPFCVSLWRMDWRYLLARRWDRWDVALVGGLTVFGMVAMYVIPHIPALQAIYPSLGHLSAEQKWGYVQRAMVWNASWLIGWEFLHRYVLLRAVQREELTGRWGLPDGKLSQWYWLAVPLSETLYHLQKPGLEALGMGIFSVILTLWCLSRKKWLVACLVHLIIEVELVAFMTLLQ
jgi:hypothetical protein